MPNTYHVGVPGVCNIITNKPSSYCLSFVQGLAKSIAWDGEGATCLMEIAVTGAKSDADARIVAKSVAGSSLAKSAIFGHDPNWGRIAAAAGYSGTGLQPLTCDSWNVAAELLAGVSEQLFIAAKL